MKHPMIKLILCLCMCIVYPVFAGNTQHYYFKTIDIRNGLSQNTVYQIIQDKNGFMWFGTKDGLNRYDGLSCRVYKKAPPANGRASANRL